MSRTAKIATADRPDRTFGWRVFRHGRRPPDVGSPGSQQPGVADGKELKTAGLTSTYHYDQASRSTWFHDGANFWSIETPDSPADKRPYIKNLGLGGVMIYSLDADDAMSTLLNAATGMGG